MDTSLPVRPALATVTSPAFLPGTVVLFHSFLAHHPWFDGDLVVIHEDLPEAMADELAAFPRLRLHRASPELTGRLDALFARTPHRVRQRASFLTLEAFRLARYDRVLFCDSDILFRGAVHELFAMTHALIACGERTYYTGESRDRSTYTIGLPAGGEAMPVLETAFNGGLMLIGPPFLSEQTFMGLLQQVDPAGWPWPNMEQPILNRYFDGQVHLVGCAYNYLFMHREAIFRRTGVAMEEARVVHFNGKPKPWDVRRLRSLRWDPSAWQAISAWHRAYVKAQAYPLTPPSA